MHALPTDTENHSTDEYSADAYTFRSADPFSQIYVLSTHIDALCQHSYDRCIFCRRAWANHDTDVCSANAHTSAFPTEHPQHLIIFK